MFTDIDKKLGKILDRYIKPRTTHAHMKRLERVQRILLLILSLGNTVVFFLVIFFSIFVDLDSGYTILYIIIHSPYFFVLYLLGTKYWRYSAYLLLVLNLLMILVASLNVGLSVGVLGLIVTTINIFALFFMTGNINRYGPSILGIVIIVSAAVTLEKDNAIESVVAIFAVTAIFLPAQFLILNLISKYFISSQFELKESYDELKEQFEITAELNQQLSVRNKIIDLEKTRQEELFLAMSHEIKTPVTTIHVLAERIINSNVHNEDAKEILNASKSLVEVADSVLNFAKINSQGVELVIKNIDFREFLESLKEDFKVSLEQKGLYIHLDISQNLPIELRFDPDKLKLILSNLISNAIKYTERGGIVVRAYIVEEMGGKRELSIIVEDSGIGIPLDKAYRIFDSFYQINPHSLGSGLGLAIVHKYAAILGGRVTARSKQGKGSIFELLLPLDLNVKNKSADKIENKEVFFGDAAVIDDNKVNSKLISQQVESLGWSVSTFFSGEEFTSVFEPGSLDLVLLDINMPEMDGYSVLYKIRSLDQDIKVVAISAYSELIMEEKVISMGFDAYIAKPFTIKQVKDVIRKLF